MRVKDLADLAGTSVRTIRYYHELHLLAVPDSGATWRSYGFAHLTRLMRIRWLVESGVPLAEVPHMLRAPDGVDERTVVIDDLGAVVNAIDQKIAVLTAQRARVTTLLERVRTHGRLSPLPEAVVRLYAALAQRPLPAAMLEAILRERELFELACYRRPVPTDLVTLVDALSEEDIDEVCALWKHLYDIDEAAAGKRLSPGLTTRVNDVVARIVGLAERVAPVASHRLLSRALELDRPAVRAAVDLAYQSPTYRQVITSVVILAKDRSLE